MTGNRKQRRNQIARKRSDDRKLSAVERKIFERHMRQLFIWRYSVEENAQARMDAGSQVANDDQGYHLLAPAKQEVLDAAYALATSRKLHWQVLAIGYCRDASGEPFRLWAWARSGVPIIAAGSGIQPLLHEAYRQCMSDLGEGEVCEARGMVMAPWDASRPIRPEALATRLKSRLHLTDHEIHELAEWEAPLVTRIGEDDLLDLEIATALREGETLSGVERPVEVVR